jgi:hypothetical protein
MATNTLQTDYWIETGDQISNLKTDGWDFVLTAHPARTLRTDLWVPEFYHFETGALYYQNIFMVASDLAGDVQMINVGKSDDSTSIYYELNTQELEFSNRAYVKAILDVLGVAARYADDSKIEIISDDKDGKPLKIDMGGRINISTLPNFKGHYITLRWSGNANNKSPVLEGFYLSKIIDDGLYE